MINSLTCALYCPDRYVFCESSKSSYAAHAPKSFSAQGTPSAANGIHWPHKAFIFWQCASSILKTRCAAGMRFKPNADCKENGPVANTCKHILQCSFVTIGLDVEQDHNMSWIVKLQAHQLSSQSSNRTTSRTSTSWAAKPWGMMQWNILKTSENHRFSGFWVVCQGSLDMLLMCDFHRFSWHFGDEWLLKYLLSDLMVNLEVCGSSDVTRSTRSSWAKWLIIWTDLAWFLES